MSIVRRFLIAPSLARLVRKERGSSAIVEGYFPTQAGRNSHVRVEDPQSHLVLVTDADGQSSEERTEVPKAHGDALLAVCAGKVLFDRSRLALADEREALVDSYTSPASFQLVSVLFDREDDAEAFLPPAWFATETTGDAAYGNRSVAIEGAPPAAEIAPSNAALDALIDVLEASAVRAVPAQRRSADDFKVIDTLRRLVSSNAAGAGASLAPQGAVTAEADETAPGGLANGADALPLGDERMEELFEGLSQALEAAPDAARPAAARGSVVEIERWGERARRSEG